MHRRPTPFRCRQCGAVRELDAEDGWMTISPARGRGAPPCDRCGPSRWVRCGTMSEFYDFWDRKDVCRVGEHVARDVTSHDVQRGNLVVSVRVCTEHHDALRAGWRGWTLVQPH